MSPLPSSCLSSVMQVHLMFAIRVVVGVAVLCSGCLLQGRAGAAEQGAVTGKMTSAAGTILHKEGKAWLPVKAKADVHAGDLLLALPGVRGEIDSKDGALQLSLWGNLPEFYNAPVLESQIELQAGSERVFDLTLVHGRIVLAKSKGKDGSMVRVRFLDKTYDLNLAEVGTQIAVEQYGRWPRGSRFSKRPRPEEVPTLALMIYVIKGRADLKIGDEQFLMNAPSTFHWDNLGGQDRVPQKADRLPAWTEEKPLTAEAKQLQAAVQKLEKQLAGKAVEAVLVEDLESKDANVRKLAVYSVAAINDLPHLVDALGASKQADVRETAITALRHWIGQGPGQDMRLYRFLVDQRMLSTNQAEILLQLLHSFDDGARDRAETFETLIEYLRHDNMAIRELARWHLYRWAIAGR